MKTLNEIAEEHGTDKAVMYTRVPGQPGHGYAPHYDFLFKELRHAAVRLLEIGVGGGESIRTWLEYFDNPDARIFGVDITQNTNPWNSPKGMPDPRYGFNCGDQSDPTFLACLLVDRGPFDIVIDDGSHMIKDIAASFQVLWPALSASGLYCVEDIGVGYSQGSIFVAPNYPTHGQWLNAQIDKLQTDKKFAWVFTAHELAVFSKI